MSDIEMKPVESSNLHSVGYDEASRTLAVRFRNNPATTFHYAGVPPEKHTGLMGAKSKGGYFAKHVRNAHRHTVKS